MPEELPAPLVPPEIDLRGYDFMPLYGDRLFNSETWIEAKPEARCAALRLWYHAFTKEVPSASLPQSDRFLAIYAGYGEAVSTWRRVAPQALRGWLACADGRLYHEVLAAIAIEAWEKRTDARKEQERINRHRAERSKLFECLNERGVHLPFNVTIATLRETAEKHGCNVSSIGTSNVTGNELATARSEGKRSEAKVSELQNRGSGVSPPSTPKPPVDNPARPAEGKIANGKGDGSGQQWDDPAWWQATAVTVGRPRRQGESDAEWRDGVFARVRELRQDTA